MCSVYRRYYNIFAIILATCVDIETIRDNHLVHLQQDVRRVENKVDKIDNRIWWILGVLVSTQVASMIANML